MLKLWMTGMVIASLSIISVFVEIKTDANEANPSTDGQVAQTASYESASS